MKRYPEYKERVVHCQSSFENKCVSTGTVLSITRGRNSNDFIITHKHNLSD